MSHPSIPFNTFVEKIVLHNKLVPEDKLVQAKNYIMTKPEMSLLAVLVKANLVSSKHSELINQKFQVYSEKQGIKNETPSPQSTPHQDKPPPAASTSGTATTDASSADSEKRVTGESIVQHSMAEEATATAQSSSPPAMQSQVVQSVKMEAIKSDGPTMAHYLTWAREKGASDLHISVNFPPVIRKNGKLVPLDQKKFQADDTERLLFQVLNDKEKKLLDQDSVLDKCLMLDKKRYRCCFVKQQFGWDGSFRIIGDSIQTMEALELPKELKQLTEYREG